MALNLVWTTDSLIYNNYFFSPKNLTAGEPCLDCDAQASDSNSVRVIWSTIPEKGTNIVGGPYLGGNYWNNYNGKDSDGNGLGDTPYNNGGTIQDSSDIHPLLKKK